VDCTACGAPFLGTWGTPDTPGEAEDVPVAELFCPACQAVREYEYPGWTYHTEAG
jgi:hypothetical protein